jgi:L-2-hydroxyglutarate oxidase LhgO
VDYESNYCSFLKKRFKALSSVSLFQGMEFSDDPEKLKEWIPLSIISGIHSFSFSGSSENSMP